MASREFCIVVPIALALVGLALAPAGPARARAQFEAPCRAYDTGPACKGVVVGDLNGDGHPDVGVANTTSSSVTLYMTTPDGSFAPRTDISMPSGANTSIEFADLNGDGWLDMFTTKGAPAPGVYYRLSTGGGSFSSTINRVSDTQFTQDVRVVDLNHDGIPDLLTACQDSWWQAYWTWLHVFLGVASGGFVSLPTQMLIPGVFTSFDVMEMHTSDFNHDGNVDLFATFPTEQSSVCLGAGDGTFSAPLRAGERGVMAGGVADVTGDGNSDYVATAADVLHTYQGADDGTFPFFAASGNPVSGATLLLGDFNTDGRPDVLTAFECHVGGGDGSFQPALTFGSYALVRSAAADFTGDGRLDFVATNGVRTLYRFDGNGDGTFGTWRHETCAGTASRAAAGDFNNDGQMDLAVAIDRGSSLPGLVEVRLGRSDGTYDAPTNLTTGLGAVAVVAADFDQDSVLDLTTANPRDVAAARLSLFRGVGDGTFPSRQDFPGTQSAADLLATDLDQDGHPDLLEVGSGSTTVHLYTAGGFPASGVSLSGGGHAPAVGDVDHDGRPDLVLLDASNNKVNYYRNLGAGTFATARSSATPGPPVGAALGDFDGDGQLDLVVADASTPATGIPYAVSLHQGAPTGDFTILGLTAVGGEPRDLAVGDFDGDGHLDVATAGYTARSVTLLTGDGAGGLPGRDGFGTGGGTRALAVRDLNADGRLDLVATTASNDGLTILRQPTAVSAAPLPPPLGLTLLPAYPNPMTSATTIQFTLAQGGAVRVQIFDVSGRLVAVLADRHFEPGAHAVAWNGATESGAVAPSGIYFCALESAGRRVARTLTLLR